MPSGPRGARRRSQRRGRGERPLAIVGGGGECRSWLRSWSRISPVPRRLAGREPAPFKRLSLVGRRRLRESLRPHKDGASRLASASESSRPACGRGATAAAASWGVREARERTAPGARRGRSQANLGGRSAQRRAALEISAALLRNGLVHVFPRTRWYTAAREMFSSARPRRRVWRSAKRTDRCPDDLWQEADVPEDRGEGALPDDGGPEGEGAGDEFGARGEISLAASDEVAALRARQTEPDPARRPQPERRGSPGAAVVRGGGARSGLRQRRGLGRRRQGPREGLTDSEGCLRSRRFRRARAPSLRWGRRRLGDCGLVRERG